MTLRLRLIVAFFLLSVVPLAAVTMFAYTNNVRALREAAEREADLLAGELAQRMQLVTAQLSERVEHLMDVAELQAAAEEAMQEANAIAARNADAAAAATNAPAPKPVETAVHSAQLTDQLANSLGEAAMLLNNVELHGVRPFRMPPMPAAGARDGNRQGAPPATRGGRDNVPARTGRGDASRNDGGRGGSRAIPPQPGSPHTPPPPHREPRPNAPRAGAIAPPPEPPKVPAVPQVGAAPAPASPAPNITVVTQPNEGDRLMIDMAPIRREVFRQLVPDGKLDAMTPEERQRVAAEINQRMLGVVEGLKVGAVELQKRAQEAQRVADERAKIQQQVKAADARRQTQAASSVNAVLKRSTSIAGNKLGVKFERDGKVVREVNAELNMPTVIATAFSTTRRDGGEVPFAVARDGRIHARSEEDRARLEALGDVVKPDGPSSARLPNWIVVTTTDPSGTGLKLGIARPVGDSLADLRRTAARNAGVGLLLIVVALVGIVPLSGGLTRNLRRLTDGVTRFARGDYATRVPVRGRDEIAQLAAAFNQMAEDVERHQRAAIEQERIKRELELGRQIQSEMLPHAPLRLGLTEVKGVSVPAREVGGDFFNYFELKDGRIALLVGDVSGKGVGAALLMANIQASLQTRLALGQGLAALAEEIDRDIEMNSPGPVYATLFVGILDPATRILQYVNAGHHPQFVLRADGGFERMASTGLPVGLFAGHGYGQLDVQLAAGDVLFFYTDGCVEAENETNDMFGADRLERVLTETLPAAADDVLGRVEGAIKNFRGSRELFDDATMMVVKVG